MIEGESDSDSESKTSRFYEDRDQYGEDEDQIRYYEFEIKQIIPTSENHSEN